MVAGLLAVVPEARGVAIAPAGAAGAPRGGGVRFLRGNHPVPDRATFAATSILLRELARQPRTATVLVLLSGGASALFAAPARGLRRSDKVALGRWLLRSGLPIDRMNAVRKHVSAVKGGGLVRLASPRRVITLVLSDVPGDDLGTIGSGPTVADPSTFADALDAVERAPLPAPAAARRHLEAGRSGRRPETLKPGDPDLRRARAALIGSSSTALAGAAAAARERRYAVRSGGPIGGEAAACAKRFVADLPRTPRRPTCVLAAGETTVTVHGGRGRGGRNQEFALAAALDLPAGWALLAAGTDGVDGRTPAAGGYADQAVKRLGRAAIERALREHDSYRLLAPGRHLLVTGPTGTNVTDLVIAVHPGA
jgi:hydroxypyruvate reductase